MLDAIVSSRLLVCTTAVVCTDSYYHKIIFVILLLYALFAKGVRAIVAIQSWRSTLCVTALPSAIKHDNRKRNHF